MRYPSYCTWLFSRSVFKVLPAQCRLLQSLSQLSPRFYFHGGWIVVVLRACESFWYVSCMAPEANLLLCGWTARAHHTYFVVIDVFGSCPLRAALSSHAPCLFQHHRYLICALRWTSLAAGLLRILCADGSIREQVKVFDGIPICLRWAFQTVNVGPTSVIKT